MNIEQILNDTLNLSDFQIRVYTSLLERTGTAGQLYRRLNINRATLYRVLDELTELHLVLKKQVKTRMYFEAVHPDALKELYRSRLVSYQEKGYQLERVVHELLQTAQNKPTDSSITLEKGIHAHYRKMNLMRACQDKILRLKVSSDASIYAYEQYPEGGSYANFQKQLTKDLVDREVHTKLLTTAALGPKQRNYNTSDPEQLKEARIFPQEILPDVSFSVFDDYAIFTERKGNPDDMLVITIKNHIVANFLKSLFDFIFDRSVISYKTSPLPTFTTNAGVEISLLGIGTSEIGGHWHGPHSFMDDISDIDQLRHSLSTGSNYIDTCLMYGSGHTVELVSKAITNIPRTDLFINAKLTRPNNNQPLHSLSEIEAQCDRYLSILKTDYIDQFQIHSKKTLGKLRTHDVFQEMERLVKSGKVKHIGVSNFTKFDLVEAQKFTKYPLHSNEIPYGVFIRDYEQDGTLEYMREKNMTTISYFTIRKGGMMVDSFFNSDKESVLQILAKKYQKTPTQVAINWVTHFPRTLALIKSTNGTHIRENTQSIGWEMDKKDYELISSLTN